MTEIVRTTPLDRTRRGRFYVNAGLLNDSVDALAAAQKDCAVMHCEYRAADDRFEVEAICAEFDPVPKGRLTPEYEVELRSDEYGTIRTAFKRKP